MGMFAPATKESSKLRLAVFGPSGSGKTYTSLAIAKGIAKKSGKKIALIDTERKSARKYSEDKFDFDVCELEDRSIEGYIKAITDPDITDHAVLIIDSLSHAWQELLMEIDRIAKAKFRGNSWAAWSEGTPKQRSFIEAILNYPGHIIATMRVDTEWSQEQDPHTGKSKPVKIGLKPNQGKNIEYEFDMLMELNQDHHGTIIKDRTSKFQDQTIDKPGEDLGEKLVAWLSSGKPQAPKADRPVVANLKRIVKEKNINDEQVKGWLEHFGAVSIEQISDVNIGKIINRIELETSKKNMDKKVDELKKETGESLEEVF